MTSRLGRRLVLVRHGRTAWNLEGRAQGHTDVPLDEVGRAQAQAAAAVLAAMRPDALWASDLARARETAAYVARLTGLDVRTDARLREFDVGERAGLTLAEFAARFPSEHVAWVGGHATGGVPGAETLAEVESRLSAALAEVLMATPPGGCAVVVSHGACLRAGLRALLGWQDVGFERLRGMDNCGWAVLEDAADGRGLRLTSYNETVHPAAHDPDFASDSPVG